MVGERTGNTRYIRWIVLACLVVPMAASYFFDDMFSSLSHLFETPGILELGWNSADYGLYTSGYSVLCVFGGLVICGMLLDKWGVRVTGYVFVGMMIAGASMVVYALTGGFSSSISLEIAYLGCMLFGLGSEIAGVAVTRSIARWFENGPMALAMGLQLAIARLGTAFALVFSPVLVKEKPAGEIYTLSDTAAPALFGLGFLLIGLILWLVFIIIDSRFKNVYSGENNGDAFRFQDVIKLLGNRRFIMTALLCVFFYSSIVSFKKFAGAILIPRFDIPVETSAWMVSMLPFATVVFAPIFGLLVDKVGKGTLWMIVGAALCLIAHLMIAFAPQGFAIYGYISMILLGFGYSLVPAAMWPSVPRIVPVKVLGTAFALIYWVQNLGLMTFKIIAGKILASVSSESTFVPGQSFLVLSGPVRVELMFVGVCIVAMLLSLQLHKNCRTI